MIDDVLSATKFEVTIVKFIIIFFILQLKTVILFLYNHN